MSKPSAPYFHKTSSDTFHWETSCHNNLHPAEGWVKTSTKPSKEQCNHCKAK